MSEANRIGKLCWHKASKASPWRRGTLRHWGLDSGTEYPGSFTTAIVEDEVTGRIKSIYIEFLCFDEERPE